MTILNGTSVGIVMPAPSVTLMVTLLVANALVEGTATMLPFGKSTFGLVDVTVTLAPLSAVHPVFRTPAVAIVVTSAVALVLALSGHYAQLALASAISRLLVYLATCASTLRLRSPRFAAVVRPPTFVVPFGAAIPATAILVALAMLAGARVDQLVAGALALAAGGALYAVAARREYSRVP